jgi:hypothetical protein
MDLNLLLSWIRSLASTNGATCVEAEWGNFKVVLIRDSKKPVTTIKRLSMKEFKTFISGLRAGFSYEKDYDNYGTKISLKNSRGWFLGQECDGISMSHPTWGEPLWFSREEWDKFLQGVNNGEFTMFKLLLDKLRTSIRGLKNHSDRKVTA